MSLRLGIGRRIRAHRLAAWRDRDDVSAAAPIVIGGCPRSGTTLLRKLLDAHPRICCGPESALFFPRDPDPARLAFGFGLPAERIEAIRRASASQTRFVERFFAEYAASKGKPRWAEKSPLNIAHLPWILEHFPDATVVHVIRDGRDTACSLRSHPEWRFEDGRRYAVPKERTMRECIETWVRLTGEGMRHRGDPRYGEMRYEDLVREPRSTLDAVMRAVGEELDPAQLEVRDEPPAEGSPAAGSSAGLRAAGPISASSIGRWRRDMTPDEIALFRDLGGERLVQLGYEPDDRW